MRNINRAILFAAMMAVGGSQAVSAEDYYLKTVEFPAGISVDEKAMMAGRVVPTQAQLDWQRLGLTAFLHFGINTFTDREWGDGKEDPAIFNPVDLDAGQWVKTLKDAGFKMVILTAKHHDGFCLWPTATTEHSVKASPWRDGKGDVVRELRNACDKYGMKLGLYLSPWDRNAPCYGDSEKYNDMFVAQLTELLSNYGKIDEVWFDGACGEGPNGKKQVYDLNRFRKVISDLQPDAVVAIMGDDVRWVGNEKGLGRQTEWSSTVMLPDSYGGEQNTRLQLRPKAADLGSREMLKDADRVVWWPSEVDVSIRPGWFYHDNEQPKTLRQLAEIYIGSVGQNSVLLLNIPPDRRGLIASADSIRLAEFGRWKETNFPERKQCCGNCCRMKVSADKRDVAVAVNIPEVNCVEFGEDVSRGQRVEKFTVDGYIGGQWKELANGTTIGLSRIMMFDPVKADYVRISVDGSRGTPHIASLRALSVKLPDLPVAEGVKAAVLPFVKNIKGSIVTFTLDSPATVGGISYIPPQEGPAVFKYVVETSVDGKKYVKVDGLSGEFSNIENNPIEQTLVFPKPVTAKFLRLTVKEQTLGGKSGVPGEFKVLSAEKN